MFNNAEGTACLAAVIVSPAVVLCCLFALLCYRVRLINRRQQQALQQEEHEGLEQEGLDPEVVVALEEVLIRAEHVVLFCRVDGAVHVFCARRAPDFRRQCEKTPRAVAVCVWRVQAIFMFPKLFAPQACVTVVFDGVFFLSLLCAVYVLVLCRSSKRLTPSHGKSSAFL